MQGKKLLASFGGLLALASAPSFAVMSLPDGWYLEANVGSTQLSGKNYPGKASPSGLGGNANVGYKFMPYFATELGYTRYANTSITDQNGTKAGSDKHYSYDIAARGILPIVNSGFELFAKLGVERVCSSLSIKNATAANNIGLTSSQHSVTGLYIGGGAQYYVTPELAINAQWNRATGNNRTGTLDLFSGGLSFIFT